MSSVWCEGDRAHLQLLTVADPGSNEPPFQRDLVH